MEFSNFIESIILLISGGIIVLFGSGKIFPQVSNLNNIGKDRIKMVFIIGLIIVLAGVIQLVRHLM